MVPVPFRALQNTKVLCFPFDLSSFFSICTHISCFNLKKKCVSEAADILARELYGLVPRIGEKRDFSILGTTLFNYFKQNPISPSKIRKKNTTKPAASIVYNTHILLPTQIYLHLWFHKTKYYATMLAYSMLPSCEFNQKIGLTQENSATNALLFS